MAAKATQEQNDPLVADTGAADGPVVRAGDMECWDFVDGFFRYLRFVLLELSHVSHFCWSLAAPQARIVYVCSRHLLS